MFNGVVVLSDLDLEIWTQKAEKYQPQMKFS